MKDTSVIVDSERRVLRQVLAEGKELCFKASRVLTGSDFSLSDHQLIFDVMQALLAEGKQVNFLSVAKFISENTSLLEYQLRKVFPDGDLKKAVETVSSRLSPRLARLTYLTPMTSSKTAYSFERMD